MFKDEEEILKKKRFLCSLCPPIKTPQTDRRHRHERKKQLDRTKLELEGAEAKLVAAVMRMMTVMLIGGGGGAGGAGPQPPPLITATGLN